MRKTLPLLSLLLAFLLFAASCGDDADVVTEEPADPGNGDPSEPSTRPSVGGEWVLVGLTVDGEEVTLLADELEIRIADSEINGSGGCNSFFGGFDAADDGTLTIGGLGMTEMACADGSRMDFEFTYTQALGTATAWTVTPDGMVLTGDTAELRFEQAPEPVDLPLESTIWNFDTVYSGEGVNRSATNRADMDGVTLVIEGNGATVTTPGCSANGSFEFGGGSQGAVALAGSDFDASVFSGDDCSLGFEVLDLIAESSSYMIDENRLTFVGEAGEIAGFSAAS